MDITISITPSHVEYLRRKVFKILYLFEENNDGLSKYIHSLMYEIHGLKNLLEESKIPQFDSVLSILYHMYEDSYKTNVDMQNIRSEVFHCSDLIKKSFQAAS